MWNTQGFVSGIFKIQPTARSFLGIYTAVCKLQKILLPQNLMLLKILMKDIEACAIREE
jgi:hypothetical protein